MKVGGDGRPQLLKPITRIGTSGLKVLFPNAALGVLDEILTTACVEAELTTKRRLSYFLAQTAQETDGFCYLREPGSPNRFAHYERRRDLGNTEEGDGYRYRGGGLLMLAGRRNYIQCGNALGLPLEEKPELISTPGIAVRSACWFWMLRNLNYLADDGDFANLTRRIDGSIYGLSDRKAWLDTIKHAL